VNEHSLLSGKAVDLPRRIQVLFPPRPICVIGDVMKGIHSVFLYVSEKSLTLHVKWIMHDVEGHHIRKWLLKDVFRGRFGSSVIVIFGNRLKDLTRRLTECE